uniref:Peptidase C39 family protein n=1 Tax=Candidatus Kentrum sp. LFY TaxID=2126342 RepID=A0A450UIJ2_9GAMM|nr:MAG: Peptidase C39 family protein [Candidatus Kentron sp. LFY]
MEVILTRDEGWAVGKEKRRERVFPIEPKHAAEKLSHRAEWRKIKPKFLSMILQPVILLTELDTPSPHFVVLKEFRNGKAFLADPDRGNIRVTYDHLVEEGTNEEYSSFYAMAIKTLALISNQKVIEQARILS